MSDRSGMGKSLYIKRLADNLALTVQHSAVVTIPLHGPVVTPDTVLELLQGHASDPTCCIYHIDIAPNVSGVHFTNITQASEECLNTQTS